MHQRACDREAGTDGGSDNGARHAGRLNEQMLVAAVRMNERFPDGRERDVRHAEADAAYERCGQRQSANQQAESFHEVVSHFPNRIDHVH
ncbi:hypothetical protein D3C76_1320930 [compost metagenome]